MRSLHSASRRLQNDIFASSLAERLQNDAKPSSSDMRITRYWCKSDTDVDISNDRTLTVEFDYDVYYTTPDNVDSDVAVSYFSSTIIPSLESQMLEYMASGIGVDACGGDSGRRIRTILNDSPISSFASFTKNLMQFGGVDINPRDSVNDSGCLVEIDDLECTSVSGGMTLYLKPTSVEQISKATAPDEDKMAKLSATVLEYIKGGMDNGRIFDTDGSVSNVGFVGNRSEPNTSSFEPQSFVVGEVKQVSSSTNNAFSAIYEPLSEDVTAEEPATSTPTTTTTTTTKGVNNIAAVTTEQPGTMLEAKSKSKTPIAAGVGVGFLALFVVGLLAFVKRRNNNNRSHDSIGKPHDEPVNSNGSTTSEDNTITRGQPQYILPSDGFKTSHNNEKANEPREVMTILPLSRTTKMTNDKDDDIIVDNHDDEMPAEEPASGCVNYPSILAPFSCSGDGGSADVLYPSLVSTSTVGSSSDGDDSRV